MSTKRERRDRKRHMKLVNWYASVFSKHIPITSNGSDGAPEGQHIGLSRRRVAPDAHRYIRNY